MNRLLSRGKLLLGCLAILALVSRALAVNPEQVDAALERAKSYLYAQQSEGIWERHPGKPSAEEIAAGAHTATGGQWGGETALATYALLAAGESVTDPRLSKAITFLKTADIKGTYALGLRSQLYTFLPQTKETRQLAKLDVDHYIDAVFQKDPAKGLFDYLLDSQRFTRFDHSVSQYGVLGAWACARAGVEVPSSFWRLMQAAWIRDQDKDGSWAYGRGDEQGGGTGERSGPRASMTVAGIATLLITQDYVDANNGLKCTGNVPNPHIDAGLKWIGDHFERVFTDKGTDAPYYALYGVERVGVASGRKYLGNVNWYERGTDFLLQNQNRRGGWGGVPDTCFAMLFLARGRAPVLFNKLQYNIAGKEGDWNERPRDIANLTRWIAQKTERNLNWQIVSLKSPVAELLDAPVLFISGNKALAFAPAEEAKLREYCEDGGLIVGNPDCNSSEFTESFRKLGTHLFPDYAFRNLASDHPIYTNQQFPRSGWKPAPTLLGLSNGARMLMLLTNNSDPARSWQVDEYDHNQPDFELADDIALYAIDKKNLLERGAGFAAVADKTIKTNRTIKLARLQFAGNWNPEPGGWRRLAALLHNRSHIDLQISIARLGSNELGDGKTGANVAVLTGTNSFKLTDAGRQEIKSFIHGGGTLIVDAAGGDHQFAADTLAELSAITDGDTIKAVSDPLPKTAAIYNMPGGVIREFVYRPFARPVLGLIRTPMLAAVKVNNRPALYFSRLDLSCGLVGSQTDGITGYDPVTATAIMTNLVISAGLGEKASVAPTK